MWSIHRESRNKRNWFRYEIFIYLFEFKAFRHDWDERERERERERNNFLLCWLFHLTPPCAAPAANNLSGLGKLRKSTSFVQAQISTLCFFSNPQILSSSLPGVTSFTSPVSFPIWGLYCDICDYHIRPARAWTPALNVCT